MGPQLLCDKSALQAFSSADVAVLNKHYWLVYCPVLFIEVLGDLRKVQGDPARSARDVAKVSAKIRPGESCFTAHYRAVLEMDLLGHCVPMDGRPIRLGGREPSQTRWDDKPSFSRRSQSERRYRGGTLGSSQTPSVSWLSAGATLLGGWIWSSGSDRP
jgi:hypothetical protein